MPKPSVVVSKIRKVNGNDYHTADDLLAIEEPLEIRIIYSDKLQRIQQSISVTMRTPGHDFELALGFLFTEGIISSMEDVISVKYCLQSKSENELENIVKVEIAADKEVNIKKLSRNFYTTSSCGVCGKTSIDAVRVACYIDSMKDDFVLNRFLILGLPAELKKKQEVFKYTGSLHAAALFDEEGKLILLREDVGRHNAMDKLTGAAMGLHIIPLKNYILLLSGRASFELIQKAAMTGIKVVASVGAPSSLAVQLAKEFNITLIGFLRDDRFNIYSCEDRILS